MQFVAKSFILFGLIVGISNVVFFVITVQPAQASEKTRIEGEGKILMMGQKVYEKLCWTCHGLTGAGDGPVSMTLTVKPANFKDPEIDQKTDQEIFNSIFNGYKTMTPFKETLSKEEIRGTVLYIRKLQEQN